MTRAAGRPEWSACSRSRASCVRLTYQKQPAHRAGLEAAARLHMWNRKQKYAVLLVEVPDLERVPRPLDRVLAYV